MKTLISIGSAEFICPTAEAAAKIADLIGKLEPVSHRYTLTKEVHRCLVKEDNYGHTVTISTLPKNIFSPDEFDKFQVEKQAEEAAKETPETVTKA